MGKRFLIISLIAGIIFAGFAVSGVHASTAVKAKKAVAKPKPFTYMNIFYSTNGKKARESFFAHPRAIDVFAPQSYTLDGSGTLSGSVKADLLTFAKKNKIKVMPLVTNFGFGKEAYQGLLADPSKQDMAIAAMITEAKKNKYWGWQFDFEEMDSASRTAFSDFVKKTAGALHNEKLILSVAVIAQTSENPDDYPDNLWQRAVGVYDYASLGTSADFLSIMSYDDPTSKGPVAQYPWIVKVLEHAVTVVPATKLSLGVPFYYWQWNDDTGKRVGIGGKDGVYTALSKYRAVMHYSTEQQAPYLTFKKKGVHYTMWYENSRSMKQKIALIKKYKLHGFSAWALGLEVSSVYSGI